MQSAWLIVGRCFSLLFVLLSSITNASFKPRQQRRLAHTFFFWRGLQPRLANVGQGWRPNGVHLDPPWILCLEALRLALSPTTILEEVILREVMFGSPKNISLRSFLAPMVSTWPTWHKPLNKSRLHRQGWVCLCPARVDRKTIARGLLPGQCLSPTTARPSPSSGPSHPLASEQWKCPKAILYVYESMVAFRHL